MLNESVKMAIEGMISNKLRTLLTLLGIIIGVGAVIAMVSLGFGMKENIKNNIYKDTLKSKSSTMSNPVILFSLILLTNTSDIYTNPQISRK